MQIISDILEFMHGSGTVEQSKVLEWSNTEDPEILGALMEAVSRHYKRIVPPLGMSLYGDIVLKMVKSAFLFKTNAIHGYAYNLYDAAYLLKQWMSECFSQLSTQEEAKRCFEFSKKFLADFYLTGDEGLQRCIVDGILEHLFETPEIRRHFNDWKSHRVLGKAYKEALEWAEDQNGITSS